MTMLASQITSLAVVYSIVYWGVDQRKHQSSASLAFVWEIQRGPVNFPQKWPVTRKIFPFDDVIMDEFAVEVWHHYSDVIMGSNHQPHDCSLNHSFRRRSKKTSKLRLTGLCVWNSPMTGEFSAQMVSNAENVSIWWLHHNGTKNHTDTLYAP